MDAFEDETYQGTVEKISGVGTNTGGVTTYTVTISLHGDTRLKDAMSATATITLETRDDVLLISVDAVETVDGTRYVQVAEGEDTQRREVTLGLINNEYAEVVSGLSQGETVVVNTRESQDLFSAMVSQGQTMRDTLTVNDGGGDDSGEDGGSSPDVSQGEER